MIGMLLVALVAGACLFGARAVIIGRRCGVHGVTVIDYHGTRGELAERADEYERRVLELEARYECRLAELEERLDFAERLLARNAREQRRPLVQELSP